MSQAEPIWISEAEVVSLLHLGEAMRALEIGLAEERAGRAMNMAKTHAHWGGGDTLHAIGAVFDGLGWFGTKTWGHTHGGATPLFLLWEADGGRLAAIIEAFALGQMRTGSASGVATGRMADPHADELAIIGSGKQALAQVAAVALVRPLKTVRVFSPTAEHRHRFAERLRARHFAPTVIEASSVPDAVRDAPIITTATRARDPFLDGAMVAAGAHINAVGAVTPERQEVTQALMARCDLVVADELTAARRLATEFVGYFGEDEASWAPVRRLADVMPANARGNGVSIFKAMGMGISDLSLAVEIHRRARDAGIGRAFAHPARVEPRLGP